MRARLPFGRWLRERASGLVALALLIGAGAGLGAVVFRWLITAFTRLFSGRDDYSAAGRAAHPWFLALGPLFLLAPVVAGLSTGRWCRSSRRKPAATVSPR
ncbi:hypothetical protein [Amycolatopsis sp. FDAARGOS 1241]|uniref:hypothetical protein n=1 Tax=Amycolatopsis sp. FDAARGOS 1241 TaxID=2778070 RepID=UPI00351C1806